MRGTMEFSKKLLIIEYIVLAIFLICSMIFQAVDFMSVICAWIGLMGLSHGMYYWKAKNENRTKVPMQVIKGLPQDVRDNLDLTQIVVAIIQSE